MHLLRCVVVVPVHIRGKNSQERKNGVYANQTILVPLGLAFLLAHNHHVASKSAVADAEGDSTVMLPVRSPVGGREVRGQFLWRLFALLTIICRQFIQSSYPVMKKHNPDLPILIREASGTPARAFARFGE